MKTLVVTYLPRGERSKTKILVDEFLADAKGKVEMLDLCADVPDMLLKENLAAYIFRNYLGQALGPKQAKSLERMDRMAAQFKSADVAVVAFPLYNFSMPAAVKAYFDSIMQKGETWGEGKDGRETNMKGKKALVIMSSGGSYGTEAGSWEHGLSLAKVEFEFMGFSDIRAVSAQGLNEHKDKADLLITGAKAEIKKIANEWYD